MDPLKELEEEANRGDRVNFIPCVAWVQRGVAKSNPDKVELSPEELAAIIEKTGGALEDMQMEEAEEGGADDDDDDYETEEEEEEYAETENKSGKVNDAAPGEQSKEDDDFNKKFDMDNYDDDDNAGEGESIGDLVTFANPRDDPYYQKEGGEGDADDASDAEDFRIRPTDNLIVVGHVEGDAAVLEVYVYNDVEDALYVHHDLLLPSFPMAVEWMGLERGAEDGNKRSNLAAVGTMGPVIDVWDLDLVNSLEPDFSLGQKAVKKKKIKGYGHKDAVLALAWNRNAEHILASGSVDKTVLIWDLHTGKVASTLTAHKELIQALQWHPFEAQNLLTGSTDKYVRLFDCSSENTFKQWKADGEVEKVLWNHFDPFSFLVATDSGIVQMFDARQDDKAVWTLNAHSEGVNGLVLSTQCPGCLITGSSDKTIKVWDISDGKPTHVHEQNMKLGMIHCMSGCPDAPFVTVMGGDKPSDNVKVFDVREAAAVRNRFGSRKLSNPLGYSAFGYDTANEAEPVKTEIKDEEMADQFAHIKVGETKSEVKTEPGEASSGGASGKFRKKEKKKKKNKHVM